MKTFSEFQEEMNKKVPPVTGLGGGGGGTDSITATAPGKSLKKRVIDAGKMATVPARFLLNIKSKPDPTEKFADSYKTPKEKVSSAIRDYKKQKKVNEGAIAIPAAAGVISKVLPAAAATIGAVGTMMQIKNPKRSVYTGTRKSQKKERIPTKSSKKTNEVAKDLGLDLTDPRQRRKAQSRAIARGLKKKNKTNKKINTKTDDVVKSRYTAKDKTIRFEPKEGEVKKSQEMLDKLNNPNYFDKIMRNIRKEEAMAAPTNNVGGGQIAGTVEAGDNPPVKKKKRYIYGGTGSRKMWMNNK